MASSPSHRATASPTSARVPDAGNEEANALQALGHACEEGDTSKPHGSRTGGLREPGHAHGYRLSSQDGVDPAGRTMEDRIGGRPGGTPCRLTTGPWSPPAHIQDILDTEGVLGIIGTGRSGKTALGHLLATHTAKPVLALEYPSDAIRATPGWRSVSSMDLFDVTDSLVMLDDAALFAAARSFSSSWSKAFVQWLTIISHKAVTVLFLVQSTNLLDIAVLRSQRMALLFKRSDLVNTLYEREEFTAVSLTARTAIDRMRRIQPSVHPKGWVYDHATGRVWSHPLPAHWTDALSTPYRSYTVEVNER